MTHSFGNIRISRIKDKSKIPVKSKQELSKRTHPILELQNKIGNQRLLNLLQRCPLFTFPQKFPTGGVCHLCPESTAGSAYNTIQPKLEVGQPGDKYEQEADRVADSVMQSKCTSGCEEEKEIIRPKKDHGSSPKITPGTQSQIRTLGSTGQQLPESEREFFESRLGCNFNHVRVHTDARAGALARAVHARAFTVGNDVVFGPGQYTPGTEAGRKLLAHELVHTVQQTGAGNKSKPGLKLQRTIGEGHDLTSPRFKGDPALEACYDNERLFKVGNRGVAVSKVQQAIRDYFMYHEGRDPFPIYGVDGIFGSETERAVMDFQRSERLTGNDIDGIIGPITMELLDKKTPAPEMPKPEKPPKGYEPPKPATPPVPTTPPIPTTPPVLTTPPMPSMPPIPTTPTVPTRPPSPTRPPLYIPPRRPLPKCPKPPNYFRDMGHIAIMGGKSSIDVSVFPGGPDIQIGVCIPPHQLAPFPYFATTIVEVEVGGFTHTVWLDNLTPFDNVPESRKRCVVGDPKHPGLDNWTVKFSGNSWYKSVIAGKSLPAFPNFTWATWYIFSNWKPGKRRCCP